MHSWHCHRYKTFLDLRFRFFYFRTAMLLTVIWLDVLMRGHCWQFCALHFWFSNLSCTLHNSLFFTTVLPIEGFFLMAKTILVSPIKVWMSVAESLSIFLKSFSSSKKCTGNVMVSVSFCSLLLAMCSITCLRWWGVLFRRNRFSWSLQLASSFLSLSKFVQSFVPLCWSFVKMELLWRRFGGGSFWGRRYRLTDWQTDRMTELIT